MEPPDEPERESIEEWRLTVVPHTKERPVVDFVGEQYTNLHLKKGEKRRTALAEALLGKKGASRAYARGEKKGDVANNLRRKGEKERSGESIRTMLRRKKKPLRDGFRASKRGKIKCIPTLSGGRNKGGDYLVARV